MKLHFEKGIELANKALETVNAKVNDTGKFIVDTSKKAASAVQAESQKLTEKMQSNRHQALLKKYNPVFPLEFARSDFAIPNLVVIADGKARKDIDVCAGAIGWKSQQKELEVFHLYESAVASSDLKFVPAPMQDSVYYVDPFNKNRFIRLDCLFEKTQESKLAELQHIAYSLGAIRYSVEFEEVENVEQVNKQNAKGKAKGNAKATASIEEKSEQALKQKKEQKTKVVTSFEIGRKPVEPTLKWFAHDENILNLIHMRCNGVAEQMKEYDFKLSGSTYATMTSTVAAKIDAAVSKLGMGADVGVQSKLMQECKYMMLFHIEF